MISNKRILVTGGSGLLGRAILAASRSSRLIALCHNTMLDRRAVPPWVELSCLQGDLCADRLGLDDQTYSELCRDVDVIIHLAAITRFTVSSQVIRNTNSAGTKRIVELAQRSGARLVYVSTAYVAENASTLAAPSVYEQTKREAEALVSELPNASIVRPSIIVGDSKTGQVAAYQGLHHIVGCMVDGTLPVLPATPDCLCDFVAQDWVSDVVWAAALHERVLGTLWVTAGRDAMTVQGIVDVALRVGRQFGLNPPAPRMVPYEAVERLFVPVFLASLPPRLKRQLQADIKLARYMNQVEPLPDLDAAVAAELGLPPRESEELVLERNMCRWAQDRTAGSLRIRNFDKRERAPLQGSMGGE